MSRLAHDWFSEPLPDNVSLGERSWIYSSYAFRHYRSRRAPGLALGRDTGVYHGTFFDLGPDGQVTIGDCCTIVGAIFRTNARILVQDFVFIAHEVVLADAPVSVPPDAGVCAALDARAVAEGDGADIVLGSLCWIGARAVLLAGARIGEGAVVGAASVVDSVVPPDTVVAGNPARILRRLAPSAGARASPPDHAARRADGRG